jgi:hypothetical protein
MTPEQIEHSRAMSRFKAELVANAFVVHLVETATGVGHCIKAAAADPKNVDGHLFVAAIESGGKAYEEVLPRFQRLVSQVMRDVNAANAAEDVLERPPEPAPGMGPGEVVDLAFDGCLDHAGFDISVCPKDEQDQIILAALDAQPEGPEAAKLAAAEKLASIAVAGGWEENINIDEDEDNDGQAEPDATPAAG